MTILWPLHLAAMIRRCWQPLFLSVGLSSQCFGLASAAGAQAIPDSTLGGESSHVRSVNSNTDQIDHGAQRGRNLFHSFESFNIGENQAIQFSVPAGVQRIFSRVTGDDVSNVLGTLRVMDNADLFFINPNGIVFGRTAQLDINGSFIASTADAIGFLDTGIFSASVPDDSVLLSVNPNAFFFGDRSNATSERGAIIHRTLADFIFETGDSRSRFMVPNGETLGLLGGPIVVRGRPAAINRLKAPDGRIELGSVQNGSTVSVLINSNDQYQFQYDDALISNFDDIQLSEAEVQVGESGSIQVIGQDVTLSSSTISSTVFSRVGQTDAGLIHVTAQANLLLDDTSEIRSELFSTQASSHGANVVVSAQTIRVNAGSEISSYISFINDGVAGMGGHVSITAQDILVSGHSAQSKDNRSSILSEVRSGGIGTAGNLQITTDNLQIEAPGRVATTFTGTAGSGGHLDIYAEGTIRLNGDGALLTSDVTGNGTSGEAGDLTIDANRVLVENEGRISTSLIDAPDLTRMTRAGALTIRANEIDINGVGAEQEQWDQLTNDTSTGLTLTGILSETNPGNEGNAGPIKIEVNGPLRIRNGGGIAATAQADVNAIRAGEGGDIAIASERLFLDGGNILTGTSVSDGGDISLEIDDLLFLQNNSVISTNAGQLGTEGIGGDITINISNGILATLLQSNSDISANAFEGEGGDVTINSQGVIGFSPRSRNNLIQALGTSNPTELDARDLQSNDITAISQANPGLSGEILITTNSDPSRTEELPSGLTDASNQIRPTACRATQGSEFLVTGQGGVLPSPREQFWSEDLWEDWRLMEITEVPSELPSLLSTAEQAEVDSEGGEEAAIAPPTSPPPHLLEAQGWHTTPNGDIILMVDAPSTTIYPSLSSTISLPATCHS